LIDSTMHRRFLAKLQIPRFARDDNSLSYLLFTANFLPTVDVGDTFLVASDHNLRAFFEGAAAFTARATGPACAGLRINDFAGAVFTDWHRDSSQHADHFVIGGVHVLFVRNQHARQEQENDGRAEESGSQGDQQAEREPDTREARDQKTGSSEPGEKRRQG